MEKKTWNQNLVNKYNDIMDQLYLVIGDILREKLGETVIINHEGGETISGKLKYVHENYFAISLGEDDNIITFPFSHMQIFPFYENNIINMTTDKDRW